MDVPVDLGEAFDKAVKLVASVGVGTASGQDPETGEPIHAGYIIIAHPDLTYPLAAMMSVEMIDNVIKGLTMMRELVTWKADCFSVVGGENVH